MLLNKHFGTFEEYDEMLFGVRQIIFVPLLFYPYYQTFYIIYTVIYIVYFLFLNRPTAYFVVWLLIIVFYMTKYRKLQLKGQLL